MSAKLRTALAVLAGLLAWGIVATVLNRLLRVGLTGYAEVESAMNFSLAMLVARLLLGAAASFAAGAVAAALGRTGSRAPMAVAVLLFVFFVPVHIGLWSRFPWWYHGVFLASLPGCTVLASRWRGPSRPVT